MFVAQTIASEHKDLIHDVSFNCHGRRMATSSSDHTVKVWDLVNGKWQCTASWTTPGGSVFRVTWAHPEFGQVLATCSFDRTVAVWEEISGDLSVKNCSPTNSWLKRISIADSRTTVTDVCFAPKHLGLKLATCSSDMIVRIYEAVDVMKLSNWQLQYEFNCNIPLSCLSWGTSRMHPPLIAVGSDNTNKAGGKVLIYEFGEANRKWQKVDTICSVNDPVHDVKFAPCVGRPFHQLAIASNELTIVSLKNVRDEGRQSSSEHSIFEIRQSGRFNDHGSEVRRLSWNITGTILSSSGDDGSVRLWKANYLDNWKCFSVLKADSSAPEEERASVHNPIMSSTPGLFRY